MREVGRGQKLRSFQKGLWYQAKEGSGEPLGCYEVSERQVWSCALAVPGSCFKG